jgi:hypothetical protein
MKSTAYIYSYERKKWNDNIGSPVKIKNHLTKHYYYNYFQGNTKHPNLDCLQNKSYSFIENYFSVHRGGFIDIIKNFRSYNTVNYYNNEEIDYDCTEFFNYSQFIWPLKTTSDCYCLFKATSISIYGNESESWNLKLCSAFIVYENQEFFKQVLQSDGNQATIPMLINKILK